jgi:hypothetical protein
MTATAVPTPRFNPVFWLMWLLPGSAVVGGLSTLAIALRSADRPLPPNYSWEGARLDADFARMRVAAAAGIEARVLIANGSCTLALRNAPTPPAALQLLFTNVADADLDRSVRLMRGADGTYAAACVLPPPGAWRMLLDDAAGTWTVRADVTGTPADFTLRAHGLGAAQGTGE